MKEEFNVETWSKSIVLLLVLGLGLALKVKRIKSTSQKLDELFCSKGKAYGVPWHKAEEEMYGL